MEQRVGWLYGYYSEDPNYPDGVRVNVEAIYEPNQYGEYNGFHLLDDQNESLVDLLAESLSLEWVGWVYTTMNTESFVAPEDMKWIADM